MCVKDEVICHLPQTNNLSLPAAVESNQTTNSDESVRDETCQPPKRESYFHYRLSC